ncbi:helix-turn-helix domain-containing protein [Rhizosaccharibacter radicis]|uniref:Helix-turn-helix domain-containing protein n=1 Tax=Rhizosaccharibacter radicis TaxID=2782605 RepID=A0ABT1VXT5_9PROT|nr:helix-turn-helix domain-containing protein [Acetobacteraceae bacterium KSS12]
MRLHEIGQQLRAYRMESGMRAEEIAARLGVSRAALYRYEKGEVIKLDTVQRLAELLRVSPLSLLGIGVEYYSRAVGFFERIRQIEETADQILQVADPLCFPVTSASYDFLLRDVLSHLAGEDTAPVDQLLSVLAARKRGYQARRPGIIAMMPEGALVRMLEKGLFAGLPLDEPLRARCRAVAAQEAVQVAELLEAEPMGLQFGLLVEQEPGTNCMLLRQRDRATLAINPFRTDSGVDGGGVALVTAAPEAVSTHQRVAEAMWRDSLKGPAAAARVRAVLAAHGAG